jgi:microcystin-dependent protein
MSQPFLGEVKIISWNYNPKGWAFANGQFLPINQNQALFSLFGTTYGGNGQTTFALPDLRGRASMHVGGAHSTQGEAAGQEFHTVTMSEMPAHNHFLQADANTVATSNTNTATNGGSIGRTIGSPPTGASFPLSLYTANIANLTTLAPQVISNTGGSQPHENRQPYLVLNFIVALQGIFPSRN